MGGGPPTLTPRPAASARSSTARRWSIAAATTRGSAPSAACACPSSTPRPASPRTTVTSGWRKPTAAPVRAPTHPTPPPNWAPSPPTPLAADHRAAPATGRASRRTPAPAAGVCLHPLWTLVPVATISLDPPWPLAPPMAPCTRGHRSLLPWPPSPRTHCGPLHPWPAPLRPWLPSLRLWPPSPCTPGHPGDVPGLGLVCEAGV